MSVGISGGGSSMMGMGGYSDDKGDASSVTKSAISKSNINITNEDKQKALTGKDTKETIASINTDTKNSHTKLEKIFNKEEVEAKVQIIQTFSSAAPKAIGDYSDSKKKELTAQAEQAQKENNTVKQQELLAEAKKWDEGGIYRVALHTAAGGMGGGLAGAAANAAVASSAPLLNELQAKTEQSLIKSGMNETAAKAIASVVSTGVASGIGAMAGGATNGSSGAITGAIGGGTTDINNRIDHISRPLSAAGIKYLADHRASVVSRDKAEDFPADIRQALGEPLLLPNGKYGYVVESLQDNGKLVPVVNATQNTNPKSTTLSDLKSGNITVYRTDPDNFTAENALLRNIASDIKNGKTQQYPSNLETVGCFLNVCSQSFYNSNTDADARLIQAGITPPNTNTKNGSVPGGLYDRQNALKQLADSLKQLIK